MKSITHVRNSETYESMLMRKVPATHWYCPVCFTKHELEQNKCEHQNISKYKNTPTWYRTT